MWCVLSECDGLAKRIIAHAKRPQQTVERTKKDYRLLVFFNRQNAMILFFRSLAPLTCNFSYIVVCVCVFFLHSAPLLPPPSLLLPLLLLSFKLLRLLFLSVFIFLLRFLLLFLFFARVWSMYAVLYEQMAIYICWYVPLCIRIDPRICTVYVFRMQHALCMWRAGVRRWHEAEKRNREWKGDVVAAVAVVMARWNRRRGKESEGEQHQNDTYRKKNGKKTIIVIINTYGFSDDFLFFMIFFSASSSVSTRARLCHSLSHSTVVFVGFRLFPYFFPFLFPFLSLSLSLKRSLFRFFFLEYFFFAFCPPSIPHYTCCLFFFVSSAFNKCNLSHVCSFYARHTHIYPTYTHTHSYTRTHAE